MVDQPSGFRADIQGLRCIAVLAVIAYHARDLLPGGLIGVDVFFVVSGYVITRSLLSERRRTGAVSLRRFFGRRVLRLTPALVLCVVVTVMLSPFLAPLGAQHEARATGLAATFLVANMYLAESVDYFSFGAELNPLLHTWSLSLEEQFYLTYPLLLVALTTSASRWHSRLTLRNGLVLVGLASFLLSLVLSHRDVAGLFGGAPLAAFYLMPARAWQFIVGALLAVRDQDAESAPSRLRRVLGPAGAVLVLAGFIGLDDSVRYPSLYALVPTIGTALVLVANGSVVNRVLSWRPLVLGGDISYSWYLWHWPVIVFVGALGVETPWVLAIAGMGSVLLAIPSYRIVEERFRHRRVATAVPVFAGAIGSAVVATVVAVAVDAQIDRNPRVVAASEAIQLHADRTCPRTELSPGLVGCVFGEGERSVALVGDSNAGHFSEAIVQAARTLAPEEVRVTVVADPACPAVDVTIVNDGIVDQRCDRRNEALFPWLLAQQFDVVVVANATDIHLGLSGRTVRRNGEVGRVAYTSALEDLARSLRSAGSDVVLVPPIPKASLGAASFAGPAECAPALLLADAEDVCAGSFARSDAERRREVAFEVESDAARRSGASLLDVFDAVCPGTTCEVFDGSWIYRDGRHISVPASHALGPVFGDALDRLLLDR